MFFIIVLASFVFCIFVIRVRRCTWLVRVSRLSLFCLVLLRTFFVWAWNGARRLVISDLVSIMLTFMPCRNRALPFSAIRIILLFFVLFLFFVPTVGCNTELHDHECYYRHNSTDTVKVQHAGAISHGNSSIRVVLIMRVICCYPSTQLFVF